MATSGTHSRHTLAPFWLHTSYTMGISSGHTQTTSWPHSSFIQSTSWPDREHMLGTSISWPHPGHIPRTYIGHTLWVWLYPSHSLVHTTLVTSMVWLGVGHSGHILVIPLLHPGHILYWAHTDHTTQPYHGHALAICWHHRAIHRPHPGPTLTISWLQHDKILTTPKSYSVQVLKISWPYPLHPGHILTTLYANSRYPLTITWSNGWSHHIIINATWSVIFWPHPSQIISTTRPPLVPYEHPDNIINTPWPYYCYILTTAWSHTGYKLTINGQNFDF